MLGWGAGGSGQAGLGREEEEIRKREKLTQEVLISIPIRETSASRSPISFLRSTTIEAILESSSPEEEVMAEENGGEKERSASLSKLLER